MSKACVFLCDEEQGKKRKTKVTYLMCLILVLPLFLCQPCEEIKEKQQSESRMGINKSSGTQPGSQGMLTTVRKEWTFNLPCVSGPALSAPGVLGMFSRKFIFQPYPPCPPAPSQHTCAHTHLCWCCLWCLSGDTGVSP